MAGRSGSRVSSVQARPSRSRSRSVEASERDLDGDHHPPDTGLLDSRQPSRRDAYAADRMRLSKVPPVVASNMTPVEAFTREMAARLKEMRAHPRPPDMEWPEAVMAPPGAFFSSWDRVLAANPLG